LKAFLDKIIPKSLVGKMAVLNLSVIALTAIAMSFYIDRTVGGHLRAAHEQKGMAFTENLAVNVSDFILAEDYASLQMLVTHTLHGDSDIRYAFVVDTSHDRILAHTFPGGFPTDLKSALKNNKFGCKGGQKGSKMLISEEGELLDIYSPILGGEAGCVHIGLSLNKVNLEIRSMKMNLLGVALILSIFTIIITLLYSKKLGHSMDILTDGAENIGEGNLEHRIIINDKSEIGLLANRFNQMAESLQEYVRQRQKDDEALTKLEKLESIGDLAAGIAHDYNNLHTAVLGNIDLAKLTADKESKTYGFLCRSEEALRKAIQLTKQLITFSHGGAPIKRVIKLNEYLASTCPLYLSGSNCKLEIDIPTTLPTISIDSSQMNQVMQNLLQNACEAMPDGGKITISAAEVNIDKQFNKLIQPGKYIKIIVADQGDGVDREIAERIFDPYFSTKERGTKKGQGLGLPICSSIIAKHGGWLTCETNKDGGTNFIFYLKISHEPAAIAPDCAKKELKPTPKSSKCKMLVMDDEEVVLEVTKQMLTSLGCQVILAKDGQEAVKIFKEAEESGQPFSAVIMDLIVPGGMGGVEAAEELLKINTEARIIAASGYSSDPIMTEYSNYGFSQSLAKPYQLNELKKVLSALITL
jgi:signal transduction histidine kinase/CheY-like chemotaxis protein